MQTINPDLKGELKTKFFDRINDTIKNLPKDFQKLTVVLGKSEVKAFVDDLKKVVETIHDKTDACFLPTSMFEVPFKEYTKAVIVTLTRQPDMTKKQLLEIAQKDYVLFLMPVPTDKTEDSIVAELKRQTRVNTTIDGKKELEASVPIGGFQDKGTLYFILTFRGDEACQFSVQKITFSGDHKKFASKLRSFAEECVAEIRCSVSVPQPLGTDVDHFFILNEDDDVTNNYSILNANKWMSEEDWKGFEERELLFKVNLSQRKDLLQDQINRPLAKIINEDSFKKFVYKGDNNFQALITTEGITSAYALSFK